MVIRGVPYDEVGIFFFLWGFKLVYSVLAGALSIEDPAGPL